MSPISARRFFEAAERKGNAVPIITIRLVQPGESVYVGTETLLPETVHQESWYIVSPEGRRLALEDEAYTEYLLYRIEPSVFMRQELGAITVQEITKDQEYMIGAVTHKAYDDGYVLTDGDVVVFFSSVYYTALFGDWQQVNGYELIQYDESVKYVVLTEPVTFAFTEGPFEATPGMVLLEDAYNREDGFIVLPWLVFLGNYAPTFMAA